MPAVPFALAAVAGILVALHLDISSGVLYLSAAGLLLVGLAAAIRIGAGWTSLALALVAVAGLSAARTAGDLARDRRAQLIQLTSLDQPALVTGRVGATGSAGNLTLWDTVIRSANRELRLGANLSLRVVTDSAQACEIHGGEIIAVSGTVRPESEHYILAVARWSMR